MSNHTQLHAYLISAIDEIRSRLGTADIGRFDLEISAEGRTLGANEAKIEYKLGTSYSSIGQVQGGELSAVIAEYLRRAGWQERNNPTCLPSPDSINNEEF